MNNNKYERNFISQLLILQSNKIHPSLCVGRVARHLTDTRRDSFALAFILHLSDEELNKLWKLAEEMDSTEVLIEFFKKRPNGTTTVLGTEEMLHLDFSSTWEAKIPGTRSWDELRDISQNVLWIIFE